ncbi:hypothetical protein GGTG_00309 [Gaeumannomyces tritici R3-111a-1]|uniref:Uncharacterized protein n=1 Tax=Gaeumannomyces tritici (strain R3-111a-1) TaxID=644352 RepID=J3NGB8_GAET3|nr:hypothetical protein GGTG_00309 [Gaeumannomyces tritici R3-111a-1]EJT80308.1 hypothetical protein GGTG_00309 [Gaeumannomyces tritici R3-111a-1]
MLAKELLVVTGLVVSGAVSLPLSATAEAPAILERDLSSDINAIALEARAPVRGKKDPASVPQSQWANPFLPQVVDKPKPKMPDMEAGWSKPRESTSKAGSDKPPKVPKKNGKRDVEKAEAAEYDQ